MLLGACETNETNDSQKTDKSKIENAESVKEKTKQQTKSQTNSKPKSELNKGEEKEKLNPSLIESPVTSNPKAKTKEKSQGWATIDFVEKEFDFGTVKEGEQVTKDFFFTNNGKKPLLISAASASCGCTVPSYPKAPLQPGEGSYIKVVFNSKGKSGKQNRTVTVRSNTKPTSNTLRITGMVE